MVAPRPLMIIAASEDQSFPVQGVRGVYRYGEKLYRDFGSGDKVGYFEDFSSGHGYQKKKREAAYGWFLRWLANRGDGSPIPEPPTETFPYDSDEMRCFPAGDNQGAGLGMVRLAQALARGTDRSWDSDSLEKVFGPLPAPKELTLEISEAAREYLADVGYDPDFGARPLKRAIQRELQDPLAMQILSSEFSEGDLVRVDREPDGDGLSFTPVVKAVVIED